MRRPWLMAVVAGAIGALIGLGTLPVVIWAQGGLFCWGSICQTSSGTIILSQSVQPNQAIVLSTSPKLTFGLPGDLILDCQSRSSAPPGAGTIALRARNGSLFFVVGGSTQEFLLAGVTPSGQLLTTPGFGC